MPYLRITAPRLPAGRRRAVAGELTDAVVRLFTPPRGPSADEVRQRTTVHFTEYAEDELFVGGRTPAERGVLDVTVELSDWSMGSRTQRRVAAELTPVLARLYGAAPDDVNVRFHSYPPSDFSVGGRLLQDRVPRIARLAKRAFG